MSLLLSIPVEPVLEQVLAGTLRLTWDWVTQAFSPASPADTAQATSTAENTAAADFIHVNHSPAETIAASDSEEEHALPVVPPTIPLPAEAIAAWARIVELQPQLLQLVKKQAALLARQKMKDEFAAKYRNTFKLISCKDDDKVILNDRI